MTGYETNGWYGIVAPRNTSAAIFDSLHSEINASLADPKIKDRLAWGHSLCEFVGHFRKFIAEDIDKWSKVIRAANISRSIAAEVQQPDIRPLPYQHEPAIIC